MIALEKVPRYCEPFACLAGAQDKLREAIQSVTRYALDCFDAARLAMTDGDGTTVP